ncbi:MAG TPA: DUF5946 family protein [Bryobacteraceae bacterium]|jgi:hypothetical protein|nr:DUF5946 family protein [Bryobacteraceae bacterium]
MEEQIFHELLAYTASKMDAAFIHQHVVDAYAVQYAREAKKPISVVFGMIGLYLHCEKNFTGREVQKAHMRLAKRRKNWFSPAIPEGGPTVEINDVLSAEPGAARDAMIHKWAAAVWETCTNARPEIVELAKTELGVGAGV